MKRLAVLPAGLRGRFVVVAGLLITTTVVSGIYSMASFSRLEAYVDESLRDCEAATSTVAELTQGLEKEDDGVLLHFTDARLSEIVLANARQSVDASLAGLAALLESPDEQARIRALEQDVDAYRKAADLEIEREDRPDFRRYHDDINPLLRHAVARANQIRDQHFTEMQQVARWARDEARRSVMVVSAVSLAALLLSIGVVWHLARAIVWPLRELVAGAEAMRHGDFERRTVVPQHDELGVLANCMNRMAEELAEARRVDLQTVLRAKRTLEATMAALPDAVIVAEADGTISASNEAADALLSTGNSNSPTIDDIRLPAKTVHALKRALAGEVDGERDPRLTVSLEVGDKKRHFVPRLVPIRTDASDRPGVVLVLNDVTDFVRFGESRVELVAVASHELRTPLTTLRMTLLMLKEGSSELGPRERELMEAALFGVDQLVGIVDEFLDLARIEAGQLRLSYGRIDVGELASEVGRSFARRCEEVGIALRIEPSADRVELWGDARRLRAVLANLLDNAVKYTPRGGTIRVRAGLRESADSPTAVPKVEVSVIDTGPGVRPEFRDRIFDKFFRVEQNEANGARGVRGSGIGLYLARQIVEAHAGTIACTMGDNDCGANVGFLLPVEPPRLGEQA